MVIIDGGGGRIQETVILATDSQFMALGHREHREEMRPQSLL